METAEAVKLTENIFRAVNIALVNELKIIYERLGIDVWEVIEAAATKPFGFMPFYPGPGLGGHCIPIDPFYLSWVARSKGLSTRFIELAGEINRDMPQYVVTRLSDALNLISGKALSQSKILLVGLAYKKNVDDLRESPSLHIWELLKSSGAEVAYFDPHIPEVPQTREHGALRGQRSLPWTQDLLTKFDCALVVTDHDAIDFQDLADWLPLIIDTRNAMRRAGIADGEGKARIIAA